MPPYRHTTSSHPPVPCLLFAAQLSAIINALLLEPFCSLCACLLPGIAEDHTHPEETKYPRSRNTTAPFRPKPAPTVSYSEFISNSLSNHLTANLEHERPRMNDNELIHEKQIPKLLCLKYEPRWHKPYFNLHPTATVNLPLQTCPPHLSRSGGLDEPEPQPVIVSSSRHHHHRPHQSHHHLQPAGDPNLVMQLFPTAYPKPRSYTHRSVIPPRVEPAAPTTRRPNRGCPTRSCASFDQSSEWPATATYSYSSKLQAPSAPATGAPRPQPRDIAPSSSRARRELKSS